jgi:signal transduction histidine kinase
MNREVETRAEARTARHPLRGELRFASMGFATIAVFLATMWGAAWWAGKTQQETVQAVQAENIRTLGNAFARSAEVMLANGELTALRRLVSDTAREAALSRCCILLPDGQVLADAQPAHITVRELPATWPTAGPGSGADSQEPGRAFPILVPERGQATLRIVGTAEPLLDTYWPTMAGIGGIYVVALILLLLVYRRVYSGLRGICAVREALLVRQGGETSSAALEVNPQWGPEAKAWNALIGQEEARLKQTALAKTRDLLDARGGSCDRLAAACDALSQGLILVEKDLRVTYANTAAAMLLQTPREKILSAEVASFVSDENVLAAVRAATTGPIRRRTIVETRPSDAGGRGVLRFIVRPVRREDAGVAMIIIEDVTQQRVVEEARHAFVAQATHELRTPLTNIRLYTEMALEEGKDNPSVLGNCLNIINQETFRLDRTVADILSVAEIEAGTMTLHKDDVRPDEILKEIDADYAAQAREKQIQLTFHLPPKLPVMNGDREKVRLALHNLIGNALKYTPAGGKVDVRVKTDQGRLVVDVSDTGIGMSEEDRQHVFEKFYRAKDPRVAKATGSGLGLAIAREVVRLHGGDITVDSELNRGSTFTLTLPIPEEAA